MRALLEYLSYAIGLPLEVLVISALLRGPYRRFPVILAYNVVLFLTTIVDISVYSSGNRLGHTFAYYYWRDEALRQFLVFAVVISLIYVASASLQARAIVRLSLIVAAIAFKATSLLIHYNPHAVVGQWMTLWSRDLDFTNLILVLALWTMLVATHCRDSQLFLLISGLGIELAGEAIGQSLRNAFPWTVSPGDVLIFFAFPACYWIWWQALRPVAIRHAHV